MLPLRLLWWGMAGLIIVSSFILLIASSLDVLRRQNYQRVGSITFNKRIYVNDVQSLAPFLHTLKNHLVSLRQFESIRTKDNFEETQPIVNSISKDLIDIVDQLYENSQEIKLHIVKYDICKCMYNAIDNVRHATGVSINFECSKSVFAMVDPKYICHVFENILLNSVEACSCNEQGEVKVNISENARFVKVVISDNGVGIARENLKQIFEPFYSTKQKTQSWGMGLYHVMCVIKAHSGRLHCKSGLGIGTEFVVMIPTGQ